MSEHDATRDAELHELLSALLDGELDATEAAEVRAYVERTPQAQVDLDDLARVRSWVRDLPAVDPPFGFYDTMLLAPRRARRSRRFGPKAAGALVAAAAAIVVIIGLTPVADSVVPPVNAYAERHMHMISPAVVANGGTGPSGTAVGSLPPRPAGTGSPPVTSARGTAGGSFAEVAAAELDHLGAPAQVAGSFRRMGGYQSDAGVLHVMYSNGTTEISIYEQSGTVAWDALPSAGTRLQLGGGQDAWAMNSDREEVMVVEEGTTVYTVVAIGGHDEMVDVVEAMPPPPAPSMMDRVHHGCRSIVEHFGFDQ